jgi:hypothetical protein
MLAVGGLLGARLGNWWMAGLLGALAALTRSYGVLLVIPYAVLFLQQYKFDVRRWFPNAVAAALPVLGPIIFAYQLRRVWGDALAFIHVQEQWARFSSTPWGTLRCALYGCSADVKFLTPKPYPIRGVDWGWVGDLIRNPSWSTFTSGDFRYRFAQSESLELISTLLFLALAIVGLRALPLYQSVYLIPGLLIPLFGPSGIHPLMSMPRFGLTLFPIFVMLALLLKERRVIIPVAIASIVLLILFTAQFAQWYWVS